MRTTTSDIAGAGVRATEIHENKHKAVSSIGWKKTAISSYLSTESYVWSHVAWTQPGKRSLGRTELRKGRDVGSQTSYYFIGRQLPSERHSTKHISFSPNYHTNDWCCWRARDVWWPCRVTAWHIDPSCIDPSPPRPQPGVKELPWLGHQDIQRQRFLMLNKKKERGLVHLRTWNSREIREPCRPNL